MSRTNNRAAEGEAYSAEEAALLDASCRWPLLVFFGKGIGWLVLGSLFMVMASIKFHGPGFLSDISWLSLGRVKQSAMNMVFYGFATQAGFGLLLWLLVRLGRFPLLNAPMLFVAGAIYNVGVFLGILGILGGATTGHYLLEMPRVAWPFILVALGVVALWGLLTFHCRRVARLYVSQWFLVAGLFWFCWALSTAVYLLVFFPVRGVMQAVVDGWFVHQAIHLWLGSIGLAVLFYYIPKCLRRPLYSRQVALMAFWTLAFAGGLGGAAHLSGGPVPNWLASLGIAGNILLVVPLVCVAYLWHGTLEGAYKQAMRHPILRWMIFAAAAYLVGGFLQVLVSFRTVGEMTLFTHVPVAAEHLLILGFFGMAAMGSIYDIFPRVTGVAWPSAKLTKFHWNATAAGLALYFLALVGAGLVQGAKLLNPEVPFMEAIRSSIPMLGLATVGLMVFFAGQVAWLIHAQKVVWQVLAPVWKQCCANCCGMGQTSESSAVKAGVKS